MNYLLVALGGGIGAAARYGVNVGSTKFLGGGFPWHTLIVNVLGCFIMGVLTEAIALRLNVTNDMRLFLMTGILGGFTTFSAFALDFALMWARRDYFIAGSYAVASVALSFIACFVGLAVVRALLA